ncbi:MAG: MFS transporter [Thaumarchaeota archaeon]|nr:MFS transporter [Nitrososphaerota archaeon]
MSTSIQRQEFGILFFVSFVARTGSIVVQSLVPLVLVELFYFPAASLGFVIAGYWIANATGTMIALGVVKRPRLSTIAGLLITGISLAGFAYFKSTLLFELCVVLSGFGTAIQQAFLVPSMYSMGNGDRRHSGIGMYSVALSLGLIAGPLLSAAFVHIYGFSSIFLVLCVISFVTLAISILSRVQSSNAGSNDKTDVSISRIMSMFKRKGFAGIYLQNFLYSLLLPIFVTYGGVFARSHFDVSTPVALAMFTATFAVSAFLRLVYSRVRIRSFRVVLAAGFATLAISFLLIGTTSSFALFLAGFLLFGVPHALVYPSMTFVALEMGGLEGAVSTSYLFSTSSGIAEFIAPLTAVPIVALYGLQSVFLVMIIMPLVGLGILLTMSGDLTHVLP